MRQRPTNGWQALIAGTLFLGLLAVALLVTRHAPSPPPPSTAPIASPAPVSAPSIVRPEPPLDRAGVLDFARQSASAFAASAPASKNVTAMVGRRFEIRLPFGCSGPIAPGDNKARAGWSYNPDKQVLRLFVRPRDWSDAQWLRQLVGKTPFDRAEGFPIERPWMMEAACPAASLLAPEVPEDRSETDQPEAMPELALVRLIAFDAPRSTASGERGYTVVLKRAPETVRADLSFALVLNGRIGAFSGDNPVLCTGDALRARPHCVIAVQIDRTSLTDAAGTELAAWEQ